MVKWYITAVLLLLQQLLAAQQQGFRIPDSLLLKTYDHFEQHMADSDDATRLLYAKSWLQKAQNENNIVQKALAYRAVMHAVDKQYRLQYADSILYAAKFTGDDSIIGSAYLTTGAAYYDDKQYAKALENYLKANSHIIRTNDPYLKHKVKFTIASIKYYLGYYEEGIALFQECIDFFREENDLAYLKSLHGMGLCYNRLSRYDISSRYNQIGLAASRELDNTAMVPYFNHSEGINLFGRGDYHGAIRQLKESLTAITQREDFANEAVALFYIGKAYWELGEKDQAVLEFLKVDHIVMTRDYFHPDLKENYELLVDYYKATGNLERQLHFMGAQLKMINMLNRNYRDLPGRIYNEYDTEKLEGAMSEVRFKMNRNKVIYGGIISTLVGLLAFAYQRHVRNQRYYRKRFEELMKPSRQEKTLGTLAQKDDVLDIKPEVVATILKNLENFEAKKKYTGKDLSTMKVASMLNTNQKYLSKIILHYRGKNFIQYLSDLKIDYIVELLKTQPKFRNYTNKALGEEAGFGSTQIFTQAFRMRTGIRPTYFIQELNKETTERDAEVSYLTDKSST